jgi:hypothetical protein
MADDLYIDESVAMSPVREANYKLRIPPGGWRRKFPKKYVEQIRPIAETLSVLDGAEVDDWVSYLQEADAVYRLRPDQKNMWSWIQQQQEIEEDPTMRDLWEKLQVLKALKDSQ